MFATLERDDHSLKIWFNKDLSLSQASDNEVEFRRFYMDAASIEPYILPKHRNPILRFQFLSAVGSSHLVEPSVVLTVTERKAFIWVESLQSEGMAFNCVQSFDIGHDAAFLEIPRLTPRADKTNRQVNLKFECSKLFHSFKDTEKHVKRQLTNENPLGLVPSALGGNVRKWTSTDWLIVLKKENLVLIQCKGLRNSPQAQLEFRQLR